MEKSCSFLEHILDAITEHIVVIDKSGAIVFFNQAWLCFAADNNRQVRKNWLGVNYLEECRKAALMGEENGNIAAAGLEKVISGENNRFYFESPCHSEFEQRWFKLTVTQFETRGERFFVISHLNITDLKIAEQEVQNLLRVDGLTNAANRRYLDEFLAREWNRCARYRQPLSMALIDIDHFKLLNDTYGHQRGDDCLKKVASVLKAISQRPGDLCARYGGDEFALILGNTDLLTAGNLAEKAMREIRALKIPNKNSPVSPTLTISIGLFTVYPDSNNKLHELINKTDSALYTAKNGGRNRICKAGEIDK